MDDPTNIPAARHADDSAQAVRGPLESVRRSVRRVLVAERVSQAVAFGIAAIAGAALVDFALRLPPALRMVELAALVVGGAAWFAMRVVPAWRFAPPLVEVALRLERGRPAAEGRLAAAADLADDARQASPLAAAVIREAAAAVPMAASDRVDARPARRAAGVAAIALAGFVALATLAPEIASIGVRRLVTPFADVQWPARTMVEAALRSPVHPRGTALPLRAKPVRGDASAMRVEAEYRVLREGRGEWRRVVLSLQPDGIFERLVEADGDVVEVRFMTPDMETLVSSVRLAAPPAVESASATMTPPAYARGQIDARTADLGNGTDRRALVAPPVLAGSDIVVELRMVAAVPPADGEDRAEWMHRTVSVAGDDGTRISPQVEIDAADPMRWTVRWTASGRGVLELRPVGEGGIEPAERIAFEIPAIEDAAPSVAIVEPAADETVTVDASPKVLAEARDDLGVTRSWIDVRVLRDGAAPRVLEPAAGSTGPAARMERTLALRSTGVEPGDRVECIARVMDAYESAGVPREPVASAPRVFRVISASELADQVRSRLGQLREAATRLREEQGELAAAMEATANSARAPGADAQATASRRAQLSGAEGRMADRVGTFERSLEELGERLARNGTDGDGLDQAIEEAAGMAREAGRRAQEASRQASEDAAEASPESAASATESAAREARAAEQALADLEAALQRDRETAELSRRIDRLAERIAEASRQTQSAAERSVGQSRDELEAAVRDQLDRAAEEQREAAAEARSLASDLERRAEEVAREDRPEAGVQEAMREAAREAEERGLARQLEQAATQTEENQVQAAQQSQQQAAQAVEAMQQAMRAQRRARTEELRRRMGEIVDALRSLLAGIEQRTLPVQRLAAEDAPSIDAEAGRVLVLSRDAAGIAEQAAAGGEDLRRAASLVGQGAEQLDDSATALRAVPVALERANGSLEDARASVQEALAAAQQAAREAERAAENRRREELRGLYAQVLERQRSAREGTERVVPAPGKPADRRAFIESRRIATEQSAVTGLLQSVSAREDVAASDLFRASNEEMVEASTAATRDLSSSAPSLRTVLLQQEVEQSIASLMEALEDPPEPEDPFAESPGQDGGGEGQSGGGGGQARERVPPIAELRLLRTMSQRILDDTAAAERLPAADQAAYLGRIAERQRRVKELGERWVESMRASMPQGMPQPAPDAPEVPDPQEGTKQ
jgi:hypothetical protein